ncbi:ABC transporter, ATP-binding protein [Dialister invisus DSM 15470]|jgi:ABC-type Fe3+/spermidine/putrescine transport system ATPase subunit|uniref:ABC-type quaternary amine transporter n=1 Tax=Dialister invisus DSM 15470 TaxID=592028 RepID=C9LNM9_9FIRM|nr:ABC transporter ATP-binding protein [Dialister invisus]EEW97165.1 ABC transporter, ATP-binding protein [Dialister invisus DSM 15470]MBS1304377.1 ABC transporter ATP-binding protein [Dialister sp.]
MSDLVLQLKQINKYFGRSHVIKDVNIDFEKGHFVTFLGPSGCGKTTLLRMVAGFYEPDDGEILLNGKRIERIPPYSRNTAMVFQEYALFPHMNVFDNVSYGLRVKNRPKEEIERRVKEALDLMQLKGMEDRFPNQMSGGQQQRVAVARALVMNPEVLLLDEPLSNLDAKLRESVRVELRDIQKKMGLSTIYVTHDQSEALSMSDMIVVLKGGVVHQTGSPQEIYFEPKTPFVADFIGTTNLLSVKGLGENTVSYGNDRIPTTKSVNAGQEYCLSIRPECLKLVKEAVDGQVNVKVTIQNKMFLGEKIRYFVNDSLGKEWIIDIYDPGRAILEGEAYAAFPFEKAWLIEDLTD